VPHIPNSLCSSQLPSPTVCASPHTLKCHSAGLGTDRNQWQWAVRKHRKPSCVPDPYPAGTTVPKRGFSVSGSKCTRPHVCSAIQICDKSIRKNTPARQTELKRLRWRAMVLTQQPQWLSSLCGLIAIAFSWAPSPACHRVSTPYLASTRGCREAESCGVSIQKLEHLNMWFQCTPRREILISRSGQRPPPGARTRRRVERQGLWLLF
jgi:hypothetical protein